jgi:glycosyltransferase involved in cell wall biosynthesis
VKRRVVYIVSDIDKALAFEWIAERMNKEVVELSFILILQKPSALASYLDKKSVPCHTLYYTNKKNLALVFWKIYQILKQEKPSVVHCHLLYGSVIGLTAAKLAGVKKRIYTRHHSDYHHRYFPKGIKWDKWCDLMATRIVAPSFAVKEVLINYEKVPSKKIIIIHHGFDLNYFGEVTTDRIELLKKKYSVCGHFPVVGVISRFTELKGIQFIIPAFKQLLLNYPKALLLLFGAIGDYEREIKQLLHQLPESSYRVIHFENDISAVYRLFDVFVQVSTDTTIEAFGQTYVEALASGVPSVFTLSGIAPDFIVDGQNALTVPFKNSEAIYQALNQILGDSVLRVGLIKRGRESVTDKFALDIMIKKLEELYAEQ